ncbi:MAG: PilZ domain-containing protein [Phycisphaerae bacterium]|nr:PilZ domain-containing protein [Phycisphaerae bacterium]
MATGDVALADRRTFRRVPLVCDVWQRADSGERIGGIGRFGGLAGRTLNVSDGGALIQLTNLPEGAVSRPQPGQAIELTLALPRSTADTFLLEHVKVKGEVIRVLGHGMGQPATTFAVRFGQPMPLQLD